MHDLSFISVIYDEIQPVEMEIPTVNATTK